MADDKSKEVLQGKLIHSFALSNLPSYHGALSWSSDDRISIITDQNVYIMTLLLSEDSTKPSIKYHLSSIPVKANDQFYVNHKSSLDMLDFGKVDSVDGIAVKRLFSLSSRNPGDGMNGFKSVAWSPIGCDVHSRCILATLCLDNRLSLYMSNKFSKNWTETACISKQWSKHCQKEFFPDIDEKLGNLKKRKKKVTSETITAISTIEMGYINHVSFACFTWCPALIDSKDKNTGFSGHVQQLAILAVATLDGKLTFWQVAVPILCDEAEVHLVDCDIQCSVLQPCSLSWCNTDTNKGLVAVGGVDGKIEVIDMSITVSSECKVNINKISQHMIWNDADDLSVNWISWLTTKQQTESKHSMVAVAAKGSSLIQFTLLLDDDQTVQEFNNIVIDCDHLSFICDMGVTQDGSVFTCDSDSSVQMTDIVTRQAKVVEYDLKSCHIRRGLAVSPNGLFVALFHTPNIHILQNKGAYKQVEVIVVSLVSEETLSKGISQVNHGSVWDIQTGIYQHFCQNDPPKEGPIAEFLEQPLQDLSIPSMYIRYHLTDHFSSQSDDSFTADDNILDGHDWKQEAMEIGKEIVKMLMMSSLKSKVDNHRNSKLTDKERRSLLIMSDWLVMNYSDPVTLDLALQVYGMTNERNSIALATQIRQNGIMGKMASVDPLKCGIQEDERANGDEPSSKRLKTSEISSLALPCREQCVFCQSNIPLVSLIRGQCTNGHVWKRCVVTFCVCADYMYHRCQDCENSISLIGDDESPWLQELLGKSRVCSICRGWKDSRQ